MSWKSQFLCSIEQWDKRNIVISPDLDGIISAVLLCHLYGSKIIAIYDTRNLIVFDDSTKEELANALWLDHDIQKKNILSIGHHLLSINGERLSNYNDDSFNPNVYFDMNWRNCFNNRTEFSLNKFPFSTILLLIEALNIRIPNIGTKGYSLLLQADGIIDVVSEYYNNCLQWKDMMFEDSFIVNSLVNGEYFNEPYRWVHSLLIKDLKEMSILNQISSKSKTFKNKKKTEWDFCKGYQSLKDKTNLYDLENIVKYICIQTGWLVSSTQLPKSISYINKMNVLKYNPRTINTSILDNDKIFSFAITFNDCIKVTMI